MKSNSMISKYSSPPTMCFTNATRYYITKYFSKINDSQNYKAILLTLSKDRMFSDYKSVQSRLEIFEKQKCFGSCQQQLVICSLNLTVGEKTSSTPSPQLMWDFPLYFVITINE